MGSANRSRKGPKIPQQSAARRQPPLPVANDAPVLAKGWALLAWPEFSERWKALIKEVRQLRERDPENYKQAHATRFLALLYKKMTVDIPTDPGAKQFRQGKTMGSEFTFWRRAKIGERFRLFFRYHSDPKTIVFAWLNDEGTLRTRGGRSDVYEVFKGMLEKGKPPSTWAKLISECKRLDMKDLPKGISEDGDG